MDALLVELAGLVLAHRLEDRHDVNVAAVRPDAGKDAAAVDEDAGDVDPRHGHEAAGHVLVAAAERQDAVMVHAGADDFDAIGDDLAGHEAVAHALVAHHDAVGRGRSTENLRHAAACANAFDPLECQAVEVSIARRDIAEERSHTDHGPAEVIVQKPDGPQHGAVGGATHSLGGHSAVALLIG